MPCSASCGVRQVRLDASASSHTSEEKEGLVGDRDPASVVGYESSHAVEDRCPLAVSENTMVGLGHQQVDEGISSEGGRPGVEPHLDVFEPARLLYLVHHERVTDSWGQTGEAGMTGV